MYIHTQTYETRYPAKPDIKDFLHKIPGLQVFQERYSEILLAPIFGNDLETKLEDVINKMFCDPSTRVAK